MKYAVIADVHGNFPALEAVMEDARQHGAEEFIFLGDYFGDFPWPEDVTETVQRYGKYVVRGNKEDYLLNLEKQDQSTWTRKQFAPLYWAYRRMTPEQRAYYHQLPAKIETEAQGVPLYLTHSFDDFRKKLKMSLLEPFCSEMSLGVRSGFFSREGYDEYLTQLFANHPRLLYHRQTTLRGVYLFGHSHVQWSVELDGVLFANPGSCGVPLDLLRTAPYLLLTLENGEWQAEQRRVSYDLETLQHEVKHSELYQEAEDWLRLIQYESERAEDIIWAFFPYMEEVRQRLEKEGIKDENAIWHEAVETWLTHGQLELEERLRRLE